MGNNSNYITCADIGGSHVTAAVIDPVTQTMIEGTFVRLEINSKGNLADIVGIWGDALKQAGGYKKTGISRVALAMPGPFDYENGISYITGLNKYEAIYGLNVKEYFAAELGLAPEHIKFRNDAEATIAGEVVAGAGKGYTHIMGVTLGTGFGSAQFKDGESTDLNLGRASYKESIADDYLSTRWFLKRYFELTGLSVADGVRELAAIARTSKTAENIFKEFAVNMSDFLKEPVKQAAPEALILCGNISKASALFLPIFKKRLPVRVKLATLGEQAPLIGAAALFAPVMSKSPIAI